MSDPSKQALTTAACASWIIWQIRTRYLAKLDGPLVAVLVVVLAIGLRLLAAWFDHQDPTRELAVDGMLGGLTLVFGVHGAQFLRDLIPGKTVTNVVVQPSPTSSTVDVVQNFTTSTSTTTVDSATTTPISTSREVSQ